MTEKRLQARSICADLVRLHWQERSGAPEGASVPRECAAVLEDISSRGACLQVESPVPIDIAGSICHGEDWSAECRIRYCTFREIGYFVGIEFINPDAWRRLQFRPEHLLDLCHLVQETDSS